MKPLTIRTRRFPPGNYFAITIFPFIFHKGELTDSDLRHERTHLWQQMALLVVPFYLLYFIFWIVNLIRYRDQHQAYRNIPFERSAYALEGEEKAKPLQMSFDWLQRL